MIRQPRRRHPGFDDVRFVLVTPDIDALLDGHPRHILFPCIGSDLLIANFCAGWRITVSKKKNAQRPDAERLEGFDEVWALCVRNMKPGWRLLGRFVEPGVMILTRPWDKRLLAPIYPKAAQEVIEDWQELFGNLPPFRSPDIDAYFKGNVKDVDENE